MKLVFEFVKTGNMIYISHLDMSRLFLRVFRMTGLRPAYSQGFTPHPKLSFALPLSLGIHSVCELLEFETDDISGAVKGITSGVREEISKKVSETNGRLPEGMRIKAWYEKPGKITKTLAALAMSATYEFMCNDIADAPEKLETFFKRDAVTAVKRDKKTNSDKEADIRSMMLGYRVTKHIRGRLLAEVTLAAAPSRTLNPRVFFSAFCQYSGIDEALLSPVITRTVILGADGRALKEVLG